MIDKLGKYLGEGFRRVVYDYTEDPGVVVKFLKNLEDNHNQVEYDNWQKMKDTERGKWLAPCHYLSEDCRFLLQTKVKILDEAPSEIPDWIKNLGDWSFGGNKSKHWGMLGDQVVLVDYGDKELWNI